MNIFLFFLFGLSYANENSLRDYLFIRNNYNKTERPVIDYDKSIQLNYGIEIYGLNYFNQKDETIEFNILLTQEWNDKYLNWNRSEYNVNFIDVESSSIWVPDIELYNAGTKPFPFSGGIKDISRAKLYYDGKIRWTKFVSYSFSCMLDLHDFPFDKQRCNLLFGSWKHTKAQLDLIPFNDSSKYKNISVYDKFSHNEWKITNIYVDHKELEYLCCPGDIYPNTYFYVELERHSMKYLIVMIFAIFITLSGFAVSFIKITNYKRTFVLVFVPLAIIWLQIYIADKIPIIEYSTLMERFFILCFSSTMALSLESALLYCLLTKSGLAQEEDININYDNIEKVGIIRKDKTSIIIEKYILFFDVIFRTLVITIFFVVFTNLLI